MLQSKTTLAATLIGTCDHGRGRIFLTEKGTSIARRAFAPNGVSLIHRYGKAADVRKGFRKCRRGFA
jgi:ABC-type uncharacterized transport system ATPase subunit